MNLLNWKMECGNAPTSPRVVGSGWSAAERSGGIYLRWERSSSEISAIGAMAEKVLVSRAEHSKSQGEPTSEAGGKVADALRY